MKLSKSYFFLTIAVASKSLTVASSITGGYEGGLKTNFAKSNPVQNRQLQTTSGIDPTVPLFDENCNVIDQERYATYFCGI